MSGLNPFGSGHQPFNRLSLGGVRPSRASSSSHQESNNTGSLADDRQMEINYVNLKTMEENTRNLAKEMCRYEECVGKLQDFELCLSSSLLNCSLCREDPPLRSVAECYHSVVYQTRDHTENLKMIARRTVAEPCKKLGPEFNNVASALKKRELAIKECHNAIAKHDKIVKAPKTGQNIVKLTQAKRALESAQEELDSQNKLLLLEMPQFHEKRLEYFQPCLQALVRSQVNYYGETNALYTHMTTTAAPVSSTEETASGFDAAGQQQQLQPQNISGYVSDKDYADDINKHLMAIKGLSIVGK